MVIVVKERLAKPPSSFAELSEFGCKIICFLNKNGWTGGLS